MSRSVLDRVHVLIADDHAEMRALTRTMLLELGFTNVETAADGGEAYRKFMLHPAGLVVADLHMAPLDGVALTRMIRTGRDSPNAFVPVMIVSGDADQRTVVEARDAGVNDFLARPFSVDTLFTHICKLVEQPRPFVKTPQFFGPDRRRRVVELRTAERRGERMSAQRAASWSDEAPGTGPTAERKIRNAVEWPIHWGPNGQRGSRYAQKVIRPDHRAHR